MNSSSIYVTLSSFLLYCLALPPAVTEMILAATPAMGGWMDGWYLDLSFRLSKSSSTVQKVQVKIMHLKIKSTEVLALAYLNYTLSIF